MSQQHNPSTYPQKMQIQNQPQSQPLQPQNQPIQQNEQLPIEYEQLNEQQYEKYLQQVEQNTQKMIHRVEQMDDPMQKDEQQLIQPVKNPVSAYLVFTMKWKQDNPTQKFSMSHLGELWKNLEPHEKREFEEEYRRKREKYELYIASKLMKNPNAEKELDVDNKFFFPLHRIRSIMKQDKFYTPKTEAVTAMTRATEYFGEYFLEELKKITEGKNRIDTKDLFQCISVNQRIFGFLDCLIDDYGMVTKQKKSLKINNQEEEIKERQIPIKQNHQKKKTVKPVKQASNAKPLPKGQIKLTDMFGISSNK